jgi:hypothetical protein
VYPILDIENITKKNALKRIVSGTWNDAQGTVKEGFIFSDISSFNSGLATERDKYFETIEKVVTNGVMARP